MLDTYNDHNPNNPINEIECDPQTEFEEQQEWNQELVRKNKKLIVELEKLAEIERDLATFGTITFKQKLLKRQILNKY